MPDLWKKMILGTVSVEGTKGISIWCELLEVKGIDRIFVLLPSLGRRRYCVICVLTSWNNADSLPDFFSLFRKLWSPVTLDFLPADFPGFLYPQGHWVLSLIWGRQAFLLDMVVTLTTCTCFGWLYSYRVLLRTQVWQCLSFFLFKMFRTPPCLCTYCMLYAYSMQAEPTLWDSLVIIPHPWHPVL